MKTTRKILLALVLTLVVAALLSVCAFAAYDLDIELPSGAVKGDAKWVDSGYEDIDAEGSGWVMIGNTGTDYSGTTEAYPTMAKADAGRFYWNKDTDKGVYVMTSSNLSANWADWSAISALNPTAEDSKKMYAYAATFVDVTLGYYGTDTYKANLSGDDVAPTAEAGYTLNASKISSYPVYSRYKAAGKAKDDWSKFTVTKASYDSYIAKKTELEAVDTSGTALEDALVEFVYANFAGYKISRNVKENGAYVMLSWVWKQLQDAGYVFDTVEFRSSHDNSIMSTFGLALRALETRTLLFDNKFTRLGLQSTGRGFLYEMNNLKTFAQVAFNKDGTYTGTYKEGVIDLRGFNLLTSYADKENVYYSSHLFASSTGPKEVVWFNTIKSGDVEVAGIIDASAFNGATSLETLTIPASVTLAQIKANAFKGCKALKVIDVKGAVSADMTIVNKNAFDGVSGLTIKVYSELDKANMEAALAAASVAGVTVETTKVEEPDEDDKVVIPNVIRADGFNIRTKEYNGLRALFSFDEDNAANIAAETGYTLVEYGALASSAKSYETAGSSEALFAQADGKKIQRIIIFADDGTGLNKYVDVDAKQYCIAVRDFAGANTLKDIYVTGYAMWSNGKNTVITFSDYITKTGKNTISLYTLTLEMYKAGVVNAQLADEICVWDVLKNGAFAVTEADVKAPADYLDLKPGFGYVDGKFTYLDLPLRAWEMYKKNGSIQWNSLGVKVEDTATTGILWSVLVDGDNLVVVYRADPAAEKSTLPKLSDAYGASAPYSTYYFTPMDAKETNVTDDPAANGLLKTATLYSPIFTADNAKKIKALVVDYGVDEFGSASLDDTKKSNAIASIAYPEGMTAGQYLLSGCHALENFTYATVNKSYLDKYKNDEGKLLVDSLVDLTGFEKVSDYGVVQNAASIKNVLLPETIQNSKQYGFTGARALERVWTVGYDMPEAGVMDLSHTGIKTICKGYFKDLDSIDDIYMPDTFTSIDAYSMATENQRTDTSRWYIFGDNSKETKLNIHVANWAALNVIANTFYEARQDQKYNDEDKYTERFETITKHIVDYLQITYDGVTKTVLEWREAFPAKPAA